MSSIIHPLYCAWRSVRPSMPLLSRGRRPAHIHIRMHIHIRINLHIPVPYTYTYAHAYTHYSIVYDGTLYDSITVRDTIYTIYICVYVYIHISLSIYTYLYIYIYTYIYIYIYIWEEASHLRLLQLPDLHRRPMPPGQPSVV